MYREVYRSREIIPQEALPSRFDGARCHSTSIYYLLRHPEFSAFHRLRQEEVWHFYEGSPLTVHIIDLDGTRRQVHLGRDIDAGQALQLVLLAGQLFGATVDQPDAYSLIGCTVAPGFELADFEAPGREVLLAAYPQHRDLILRLTRG
jgi:predicted cupin superfamily sugar epimerase